MFTTQVPKSPRRQSMRPWQIVAGLGVVVASWAGMAAFLKSRNYQHGETAFQSANCSVAIAYFDKVINDAHSIDLDDYESRARDRKSQCQEYQAAVEQQQSGSLEQALLAYDAFLDRRPQSALNLAVRQQASMIFVQHQVSSLASPEVCKRIQSFHQKQFIAQPEMTLPSLYHACGTMYATMQQPRNAIKMYEQFLTEYPHHAQSEDVRKALAVALISEARKMGAGTISPPSFSRVTTDGTTVVEVRNDSPMKLRLVFSGPETQYYDLAPCSDCRSI